MIKGGERPDHATEDGRLAVSPEEFGLLANIGRTSAYAAIHRGEVRSVRIGNKICVPVREIERLLGEAAAQ